ncbi:MAG: class I SAM-dependent methyltransferase [Ginsengibacter sp.]
MKDNFSKQAESYAKFRPGYPDELFHFLFSLAAEKKAAWDCGTGNGQVAFQLAKQFDEVYATDISASQITNAVSKENIRYSKVSAEETAFSGNAFDMITVGQAIHWFNFEKFYKEVNRTLKPGGYIAVFGYGLLKIEKEIDLIITDFYKNTTGPYWDAERKYIDENYETIPFPFREIKAPIFNSECNWGLEAVAGFLNTWSAVQHYIKANNKNPVDSLVATLKNLWASNEKKDVSFPIFMRVGKK